MSYTKALADYAVKLTYSELPSEVIKHVKRATLNSIGAALGGYATKLGQFWVGHGKEIGGKPQASIWGEGTKIHSVNAAFVNAQLAGTLDYDETYFRPYLFTTHPANTVIPAAIVTGEPTGVSGKDYITAIVAGYEVMLRVSRAMFSDLQIYYTIRGLGSTQAMGAAVAAGKLLGLNDWQMWNTIGLIGETAPLPSEGKWIQEFGNKPLSWTKYRPGWCAEAAVRAALFTQGGAMGVRTILEGDWGFWKMVGATTMDYDSLISDLGRKYLILEGNIKNWPFCNAGQQALDATNSLVEDNNIRADDINEIIVRTHKRTIKMGFEASISGEPLNIIDCEFTIPYAVACVIFRRERGPDWFTSEAMKDGEMQKLVGKIHLIGDDEHEADFEKTGYNVSTVEMYLKDGRVLRKKVTCHKGQHENPMTEEELRDKFRGCALKVLSKDLTENIIEAVDRLETLDNISKITKLLHK